MNDGKDKPVKLPAEVILEDRCGEELAAKIKNEVPGLVEHIQKLMENSMECHLLRTICGIPEEANIGRMDSGQVVIATTAGAEGVDIAPMPPTAVVDYLCRRVASLEHELGLINERRGEALRTAESRRQEIWKLEAKVKRLEEQLAEPSGEPLGNPE